MPMKPCERAARRNYRKKVSELRVELFPTDEDIKQWLAELDEPKATYIKRLIREDMNKGETT